MRSITCISAAALIAAGPLFAEAPQGCFGRVYSDAHLAKYPAQVVKEISIAFGSFSGDDTPWMDVLVQSADQGHARRDGNGNALFGQIAMCFEDNRAETGWSCAVECDGGVMRIDRLDGDSLLVRLEYFWMGSGDDCGGQLDLAEVPGQTVAYRLDRWPDAECADRW